MTYLQRKPGSLEEMIDNQSKKFREDSGYQQMFKKELEKAGKGLGSMTPAEKKAFFNKIDDKYKGKNEEMCPKCGKDHGKMVNASSCGSYRESADPKADDVNDKKADAYADPKKGEKKPVDADNLKAESLETTLRNMWTEAAKKQEEKKKKDIAPDGDAEHAETKKEGMEDMVANKKDKEEDMKRKETMTGEKPSKVDTKPKVEYEK